MVSFNCAAKNEIQLPIVCKIKVHNTSNMFKIRINWWGQKHVFDVYPEGPILVVPEYKEVTKADTPLQAAAKAGDILFTLRKFNQVTEP